MPWLFILKTYIYYTLKTKNIEDFKNNFLYVSRTDGSERNVSIMIDRYCNKFCFVNLTTMHVCKCRFNTFNEAIEDLKQRSDVEKFEIKYIDEWKS